MSMGGFKVTTEVFSQQVLDIGGGHYELLSPYVSSKSKVKLLHNICGNVWEVTPNNFKNGNRCLYCSGRRPKRFHEVAKVSKETLGDDYDILEVVNGATITIKHLPCGRVYTTNYTSIRSGKRCGKCTGSLLKDQYTFEEQLREALGVEYKVVSAYIGYSKPITIKHSVCGEDYVTTPKVALRGFGCSRCSGNMKKSTLMFMAEAYEVSGDDYRVSTPYTTALSPIDLYHVSCGQYFKTTPNSFLQGVRCPCTQGTSKGESLVESTLLSCNLKYVKQFRFEDCRHINPLPFDFAIFTEAGDLMALIEFDGIQHYQPVEIFGGDEAFNLQVIKDGIKDEYCNRMGYPLIRIKYNETESIGDIINNLISVDRLVN